MVHLQLMKGPMAISDRWRVFFLTIWFLVYIPLPIILAIFEVRRYRNKNNPTPGVTCAKDKGPGNADMYGLGVRIAAYIQVLIGLAAATPGAKRGALISNIGFLAAFTTAAWHMQSNPSTDTLDLYVVIVLGNGLTMLMCRFPTIVEPTIVEPCRGILLRFIHNRSLDDYHTSHQARSSPPYFTSHLASRPPRTSAGVETVFMVLCQIVILALWKFCATLFWWKTLPAAVTQPGCEIHGYLFVGAILEPGGRLHTFHKALNIVGWVYWFFCVMVFLLNLYRLVRVIWGDRLSTGQKGGPPNSKFRILWDLIVVFPSLQQINKASIMEAYRNAAVDSPDKGTPDEDTPGKVFPDKVSPDTVSPEGDTLDKSRTEVQQMVARLTRFLMWYMLAGYYLIIPVEFIISVNWIPGVNEIFQTGQLLPLVGSICILFAFSGDLCIEVVGKQRKEESNGGGGGTITNSPGVIQDSQMSGGLKGETEAPVLSRSLTPTLG